MTRRAEQIPLEDDWVLTKVWHKSHSAAAILAAVNAVPPDKAFIPIPGNGMPKQGEPFDPPEFFTYPPPCDGNNSAAAYIASAQLEDALTSDGDGCGVGLCVKRDEA